MVEVEHHHGFGTGRCLVLDLFSGAGLGPVLRSLVEHDLVDRTKGVKWCLRHG